MDAGAVIIVVVVVLALPVATLIGGAIGAAALGWAMKEDAEERHADSELIELNR